MNTPPRPPLSLNLNERIQKLRKSTRPVGMTADEITFFTASGGGFYPNTIPVEESTEQLQEDPPPRNQV